MIILISILCSIIFCFIFPFILILLSKLKYEKMAKFLWGRFDLIFKFIFLINICIILFVILEKSGNCYSNYKANKIIFKSNKEQTFKILNEKLNNKVHIYLFSLKSDSKYFPGNKRLIRINLNTYMFISNKQLNNNKIVINDLIISPSILYNIKDTSVVEKIINDNFNSGTIKQFMEVVKNE